MALHAVYVPKENSAALIMQIPLSVLIATKVLTLQQKDKRFVLLVSRVNIKLLLEKMIVQTVFLESTVAMVYNATVFKRDILLLIALIALQMMAVPLQSYVRKVINV